jgi:hypothetical protein
MPTAPNLKIQEGNIQGIKMQKRRHLLTARSEGYNNFIMQFQMP